MTTIEIIAIVLGSIGLLFFLLSFLGIVSFPDFIVRLHAQGVGDTLGLFFVLVAMAICTGMKIVTIKYLLILLVTMLTNPLGTSILLQAVSHKNELRSEIIDEEDSAQAE